MADEQPGLDFAVQLLPGMGFRALPQSAWKPLVADAESDCFFDTLLTWELPKKRSSYIITVDVGTGTGLDRSVVNVTRVGDLQRPPEEVAQFVSDSIDPTDLAYVCAAVGRLYTDHGGREALMAIECNGFGLQTQSELLRHHGYSNFFIWQYEDAADAKGRFSRKLGWWTSARTRPMIISRFVRAIKTVDEISGTPDFRLNSPHTFLELQSFQIPPDGALWDASAGPGAHDDCIIACAIACHVEQTLYHESIEPLPDHRRRLEEERTRAAYKASRLGRPPRDFINTDCTADEMESGDYDPDNPDDFVHI